MGLLGIALGVGKIVFAFDLATVLIPLYLLAVVLTYFSTEEFVNVAWDSAGVTTGPVTVPLVLAMGLGLGNAVSATEGFGIFVNGKYMSNTSCTFNGIIYTI